MKIKQTRFQNSAGIQGSEGPSEGGEVRGKGFTVSDGVGMPPPMMTGKMSSRHSDYRYYREPVYVAPQPNHVNANCGIKMTDIQAAAQDARLAEVKQKLGVTIKDNIATVNGLALTITPNENGCTVAASAVGLTQAQVADALRRLTTVAGTARALAFYDLNPQLYGQPVIVVNPNGSVQVKSMAQVRINPKIGSQAQAVLDQHQGNLQMPQATNKSAKNKGKRTQLVG
ncbi:MAG: hypothetical protein IPG45_28370 [Deltaproteobacteria bacterium]|nr:hypothetical protein [Deltaproteobacteria bacterium]